MNYDDCTSKSTRTSWRREKIGVYRLHPTPRRHDDTHFRSWNTGQWQEQIVNRPRKVRGTKCWGIHLVASNDSYSLVWQSVAEKKVKTDGGRLGHCVIKWDSVSCSNSNQKFYPTNLLLYSRVWKAIYLNVRFGNRRPIESKWMQPIWM